jgi:hypothetical protein
MGKMKDEAIKEDNNVMDGTMRVWNRVCKTDVDHTKEVSFGRKFTAIDAHSQIMEATRMFGPVGEGWGYRTEYGTIDTHREIYIYCDLTMWWAPAGHWEGIKSPGYQREFGPIRGMCVLQGVKADGKVKPADSDAAKKAMTDALTKGLSHLGFNADVFLGQFDDNKYVQELKKEKDVEASAKQLAYEQDRKKFIDSITACKKPEQMDAVMENYKLWMAGLSVSVATEMRSWVLKKKTELADGSK